MGLENEPISQNSPLLQKIAPLLVVSFVVGAFGIGVGTWRATDFNSGKIASLESRLSIIEHFMQKGERCTFRDCQRLENGLTILERELASHDEEVAHREADLRMKVLEEWMHESRAILRSMNPITP